MNQSLIGSKWGESVLCNCCGQYMGVQLVVCPSCGNKQTEINASNSANKPVGKTPAYRYRYCGSL